MLNFSTGLVGFWLFRPNPDKPEKLPQRLRGTKKSCLLKSFFVSRWRICFGRKCKKTLLTYNAKAHQKHRYDKYGENRQLPNITLRALCNLPQKRCATSRMICLSSSPMPFIVSGSILRIWADRSSAKSTSFSNRLKPVLRVSILAK